MLHGIWNALWRNKFRVPVMLGQRDEPESAVRELDALAWDLDLPWRRRPKTR
ncbi:hypothetical protein ACFWH1_08640 [Streptomyces sp. NPDC127037]|uniref:hypothetical protein n=1 Tax=Streptomyces sp. NPDC127037 TaxID=3347113 RepID=UPI003661481B